MVRGHPPTYLTGSRKKSRRIGTQFLIMFSRKIWLALALAGAVEAVSVAPALSLRGGGKHFKKLPDSIAPGVLYGDQVKDLLQHAKDNCYAIPAVNCVTSSSINQVLEAAKKYNSPVMIQFSNGGSQFYAGKTIESSKDNGLKGCVLGAISVSRVPPPRPSPSAGCPRAVPLPRLLCAGTPRRRAPDRKGVIYPSAAFRSCSASAAPAVRGRGGLTPHVRGLVCIAGIAPVGAGGAGRRGGGLRPLLADVRVLCRAGCSAREADGGALRRARDPAL